MIKYGSAASGEMTSTDDLLLISAIAATHALGLIGRQPMHGLRFAGYRCEEAKRTAQPRLGKVGRRPN